MSAWFAVLFAILAAGPLEEKVALVGPYEYGQERTPVAEAESAIAAALRSAGGRQAVERALIALLQEPSSTFAAKDFACRQLSVAGGPAAVAVLARLLPVDATAEMARYALERIPDPAAAAALRGALSKSSGQRRIGIVNSLAARKDTAAVRALAELLRTPDAGSAAAHALGRICTPGARKTLLAAEPAMKGAVHGALIACGDAGVWKRIYGQSQDPMVRVAALRSLDGTAAEESAALAAKALEDPSPALRAAAIAVLAARRPEALAAGFDKLPVPAQVQALTALAEARRQEVVALASRSLKSPESGVRTAALTALGLAGDASALDVLAAAAAEFEGPEQAAARDALLRMRGPGIDSAVAARIRSAQGTARAEFIRAAGERGIAEAVPALLDAARDPAAGIRRESLRSLRETAEPTHARPLVDLLVSARGSSERRETERALVAALRRSGRLSVEEVVAAFGRAAQPEVRASLLMVLGQTGAGEGLTPLRQALAGADPDLRRAAILAVSEWPSAEPAPELLRIARQDPASPHGVLALRGFIKLAGIPSARPAAETVRMAGDALKAARQPDEKKAAVALLLHAPCPEGLEMARALAAEAEISAEAKAAAASIEKALQRTEKR